MTYYDELGLGPDASEDEINAAYRARAKREHPDKGGDPEKFARLSQAVAVLRDPARRAEYDRTGSAEDGPGMGIAGEAATMLSHAFLQVLQGLAAAPDQIGQVDIIAAMRVAIRQNGDQLGPARVRLLDDEVAAERILKQLRKKGDGPNILAKLLDDKLAAIAAGWEQMAHLEAVIAAALAMADDYDWQADEPPPVQCYRYTPFVSFTMR